MSISTGTTTMLGAKSSARYTLKLLKDTPVNAGAAVARSRMESEIVQVTTTNRPTHRRRRSSVRKRSIILEVYAPIARLRRIAAATEMGSCNEGGRRSIRYTSPVEDHLQTHHGRDTRAMPR